MIRRVLLLAGLCALFHLPASAQSSLAPGLDDWSALKKMWDNSKKAYDPIKKSFDGGKKIFDWMDPFSPKDADYDPDPSPPGMPQLPSRCKGSAECQACFEQPYADLQRVRLRFEALRRIYSSSQDMIKEAIAFGDAIAGVHPVAGLAWMRERTKIQTSQKGVQAAYDDKYAELVGTLEAALKGIAACEAQIFGEDAWFDRYGFIYYQFMADRYRRSD